MQLQSQIQAAIGEIEAERTRIEEIEVIDSARLHEALTGEWVSAADTFGKARLSTIAELDRLTDMLEKKLLHLFEPLDPVRPAQAISSDSIGKLNDLVERHNKLCENNEEEQRTARERLEHHYVSESSQSFSQFEHGVQLAKSEAERRSNEREHIQSRINALEADIVEHRRPASELNEDLAAYLGHSELQLLVSDTGYTVSRGGTPAGGLSDGEKSSIALLYFLKTLQHKDFAKEQGVVVLDDPVSSLDAQSLYMAVGFIKERVKGVGQLFILTHNWGCFRLVKDWYDGLSWTARRDDKEQPCSLYMLDCRTTNGSRRASLGALDPLLERFKTEYHFLFARVAEVAKGDSDNDLTDYVAMPNLARRLLEAFFAFAFPGSDGDFASTLGNCDFDPAKRTALQRFLNLESHGDGIGDSRRDLSQLARTPEIMQDVLALIERENKTHFSRMVKAIRRAEYSQ